MHMSAGHEGKSYLARIYQLGQVGDILFSSKKNPNVKLIIASDQMAFPTTFPFIVPRH